MFFDFDFWDCLFLDLLLFFKNCENRLSPMKDLYNSRSNAWNLYYQPISRKHDLSVRLVRTVESHGAFLLGGGPTVRERKGGTRNNERFPPANRADLLYMHL